MAKTANINIRTEPEIKQKIEKLYSQFGITVSDAVNIFFHQSLLTGGLPFEMQLPEYNNETLAAMAEAERISRDPSVKGYRDMAELFRDLEADD